MNRLVSDLSRPGVCPGGGVCGGPAERRTCQIEGKEGRDNETGNCRWVAGDGHGIGNGVLLFVPVVSRVCLQSFRTGHLGRYDALRAGVLRLRARVLRLRAGVLRLRAGLLRRVLLRLRNALRRDMRVVLRGVLWTDVRRDGVRSMWFV